MVLQEHQALAPQASIPVALAVQRGVCGVDRGVPLTAGAAGAATAAGATAVGLLGLGLRLSILLHRLLLIFALTAIVLILVASVPAAEIFPEIAPLQKSIHAAILRLARPGGVDSRSRGVR